VRKLNAIIKKLLGISGRIALNDVQVKRLDQIAGIDKGVQLLLMLKYQELLRQGAPLPSFEEVEFRSFSQCGEDGILLYIFSLIGSTNKKCAEVCAGNGIVANTANLIVNHGWTGLLVDGDPLKVATGQRFYAECPDTCVWPPTFVQEWVTRDSINGILERGEMAGEIDLLSLDMDGVDYWIWKAIECASPRVVVVEYQDILGPDRAVTVPYADDFRAHFEGAGPDYAGASLAAYVKLGKEKGYRLVGCQRYGFNAFFIRNGVGDTIFPEIPAKDCFKHPCVIHGIKHRQPKILDREWIEV